MLIQNTGNAIQAHQLERVANAKPADNGGSVAVPASSGTPAKPAPSPEQLKSSVETINKALRQSNQSLEFSVSPDTTTPVVKLVDTDTGEVLRQIPSEETLAIAKAIDQFQQQQGLLLKQKA